MRDLEENLDEINLGPWLLYTEFPARTFLSLLKCVYAVRD